MNSALVSSVQDLISQKAPVGERRRPPSAMAFAEAFYSLRTNLKLLGSDSPVQVVDHYLYPPDRGKANQPWVRTSHCYHQHGGSGF